MLEPDFSLLQISAALYIAWHTSYVCLVEQSPVGNSYLGSKSTVSNNLRTVWQHMQQSSIHSWADGGVKAITQSHPSFILLCELYYFTITPNKAERTTKACKSAGIKDNENINN